MQETVDQSLPDGRVREYFSLLFLYLLSLLFLVELFYFHSLYFWAIMIYPYPLLLFFKPCVVALHSGGTTTTKEMSCLSFSLSTLRLFGFLAFLSCHLLSE